MSLQGKRSILGVNPLSRSSATPSAGTPHNAPKNGSQSGPCRNLMPRALAPASGAVSICNHFQGASAAPITAQALKNRTVSTVHPCLRAASSASAAIPATHLEDTTPKRRVSTWFQSCAYASSTICFAWSGVHRFRACILRSGCPL